MKCSHFRGSEMKMAAPGISQDVEALTPDKN